VDFWAPWCGPCRIVSPIVQQLAKYFKGKVVTVKINIDEKPHISQMYGIMSIPTVMLFHNGKALMRFVGARSFEEYRREIERIIK
jgi:thioredoxin